MGQTSWTEMTDEEKAEAMSGNDIHVFPLNDPDIAVDYCGLTGTITFEQYIELLNNTTIPLYFRLVGSVLSGDSAEWDNYSTVNIGLIAASSGSSYRWQPTRTVPSNKLDETLRITIKAYTDAGYTAEYGQDYCDYSYEFFSHADSSAVQLDFADFEEASWDGWNHSADYGTLGTGKAYTGDGDVILCGLTDNKVTDVSGGTIPSTSEYINKTVNRLTYSDAYLVIHVTYLQNDAPGDLPGVLRIWTPTKDYIVHIPITENTYQPYRIAIPLPILNDAIKIAGLYSDKGYLIVDTIVIVAFS